MERERSSGICESCGKGALIEGTLEGVSFQPLSEKDKWLSSGIYGLNAVVCINCGNISRLSLDIEILKKMIKRNE